jgi:hypothetical protein
MNDLPIPWHYTFDENQHFYIIIFSEKIFGSSKAMYTWQNGM